MCRSSLENLGATGIELTLLLSPFTVHYFIRVEPFGSEQMTGSPRGISSGRVGFRLFSRVRPTNSSSIYVCVYVYVLQHVWASSICQHALVIMGIVAFICLR